MIKLGVIIEFVLQENLGIRPSRGIPETYDEKVPNNRYKSG